MSPNAPPDESERVQGAFYERVCPTAFPILHRVRTMCCHPRTHGTCPMTTGKTALGFHPLHRGIGRHPRDPLPLDALDRGPLPPRPLRPTAHRTREPLLSARVGDRRHRRTWAVMVFPRARAALYAPPCSAQGPCARDDGAVRARAAPGVSVWTAECARDVARDREPGVVYAAVWLARDDCRAGGDWGVGDAERAWVGVERCAVSERGCVVEGAVWGGVGEVRTEGALSDDS